MSKELFKQYEKDYCDLSALLSREIHELRSLRGDKLDAKTVQLKDKRADIQEALNSMELEIGGLPTSQATELKGMWQGYKRDLTKLDTEFADAVKHAKLMSARAELMDGAPEGFGADLESGMDQRNRLERVGDELQRQGEYVDRAVGMTVELDEIGNRTRGKLREQRDTIQHQIDTTDDTLRALGRSQRLMRSIKSRMVKNKIIIAVVILVLLGAVGTALYFMIIKPRVIDKLVTPTAPSAPSAPTAPMAPAEPLAPPAPLTPAPTIPPPTQPIEAPASTAPPSEPAPAPSTPAPAQEPSASAPAPTPAAPAAVPVSPAAVVPWAPSVVIVTPSDK